MELNKKNIGMKNLNSKDLITIGIFNAVAIVLYISIGILTIPVPFLHIFCVQPLAAILNGTVLLLLVFKVQKKGTFFISGLIQGAVFSLLMGLYASITICPLMGLLADLICGQFKSKFRLITGYSILFRENRCLGEK